MGTYWDSFIEEYGVKILSHNYALVTILEAFWYFANQTEGSKIAAYNIMEVDMEKLNIKPHPNYNGIERPCGVAPDNQYGWWCGNCQGWVSNFHVTYDETHDPRYGGCGHIVQ